VDLVHIEDTGYSPPELHRGTWKRPLVGAGSLLLSATAALLAFQSVEPSVALQSDGGPLSAGLRSNGLQQLAIRVRPDEVPPITDLACPNYSPTFPSAGGPDCTFPCPEGSRTGGVGIMDPFPASYTETVRKAGNLIKSIDPKGTIYLDGRGDRVSSHISFSYYCCYPPKQLQRIKDIAMADQSWWKPKNLNLSYATCAIDGPALDHVSFIVMLDEESNRQMMQWVTDMENRIRAAGVPIHLSRRDQEPYHTTLGVVNGSSYPVRRAIRELNSQFPPGSWLQQPLLKGNVTFWDIASAPV